MNDNKEKIVKIITPPNYKALKPISVGEIPQVYMDSLTYAEQILELIKYIRDVVYPTLKTVIDVTNENMEAMNETLESYKTTLDSMIADIEAFKTQLTTEWEQFKTSVDNTLDEYETLYNEFQNSITNEFTEFQNNITSQFNTFKNDINNLFEEYKTEMNNNYNEFTSNVNTNYNEFTSNVNNTMSEYETTINNGLKEINSMEDYLTNGAIDYKKVNIGTYSSPLPVTMTSPLYFDTHDKTVKNVISGRLQATSGTRFGVIDLSYNSDIHYWMIWLRICFTDQIQDVGTPNEAYKTHYIASLKYDWSDEFELDSRNVEGDNLFLKFTGNISDYLYINEDGYIVVEIEKLFNYLENENAPTYSNLFNYLNTEYYYYNNIGDTSLYKQVSGATPSKYTYFSNILSRMEDIIETGKIDVTADFEPQFNELQQEINNLTQIVNTDVSNLTETVQNLETETQTNTTDITNLQDSVNTHTTDISNINNSISDIQEEQITQNTDIQALKNKIYKVEYITPVVSIASDVIPTRVSGLSQDYTVEYESIDWSNIPNTLIPINDSIIGGYYEYINNTSGSTDGIIHSLEELNPHIDNCSYTNIFSYAYTTLIPAVRFRRNYSSSSHQYNYKAGYNQGKGTSNPKLKLVLYCIKN